jgi:hypothetical protein
MSYQDVGGRVRLSPASWDPAARGGRLGSGPVLLRQSARFPHIVQAQISQDGAGQHWMLSGGLCGGHDCQGKFNGWLRDGRLVPLPPVNGAEVNEAW